MALGEIQKAPGLGLTFQPGHPMGSPYEGAQAGLIAAAQIKMRAAEEMEKRRQANLDKLTGAFKEYGENAHQQGLKRVLEGKPYEGSPNDSIAEKISRTISHAAEGTLGQHSYGKSSFYNDKNSVYVDKEGKLRYDPAVGLKRKTDEEKYKQEVIETKASAADEARTRGAYGTGTQAAQPPMRKVGDTWMAKNPKTGQYDIPWDTKANKPAAAAPKPAAPAAAAPAAAPAAPQAPTPGSAATPTKPGSVPNDEVPFTSEPPKVTAAETLPGGQADPDKLTPEAIAEAIKEKSAPEELQASSTPGAYAQPSMYQPGGPLADQPDQPVQDFSQPDEQPSYGYEPTNFGGLPNDSDQFLGGGPLGAPGMGEPVGFSQESALGGYDHLFGPQAFDFTPSGGDGTYDYGSEPGAGVQTYQPEGLQPTPAGGEFLPNDSDQFLGGGPLEGGGEG